jgi:hypothetical protein
MQGETVFVSLIIAPRWVSLYVCDPAADELGYPGHDLGLRATLAPFDAGEVAVAYPGGFGESAQAVAAFLALPPDGLSVWLHITTVPNDAQRRNT